MQVLVLPRKCLLLMIPRPLHQKAPSIFESLCLECKRGSTLTCSSEVSLQRRSCSCWIARRQHLSAMLSRHAASARTKHMLSSGDVAAGSALLRRRRATSTETTDPMASELKQAILICASHVQRQRRSEGLSHVEGRIGEV